MRYFIAVLIPLVTVALIVWVVRRFVIVQRSRERLYGASSANTARTELEDMHFLRKWLFLAGFRNPAAVTVFVGCCLGTLSLGAGLLGLYTLSGVQPLLEQTMGTVPGGVGDLFLPIIWVTPWMLLLGTAAIPILGVRAVRRQRVTLVEQDLPICLEMLATLSESGLGFDAALTRILNTRLATRPLAAEFQSFQADLLAGRGRVESLRRFSTRINLPTVSIFISSLVQAELLGMGIARVLRQQANDMRSRRRERATAFANSLPVKRLFPLVICFLPGLFIWTLGPAFVQLFKMAESFISVNNF
ncbi:MAG TPA: hypothetical protein DCY79_18915 [Planctomycetaceae bacterium]|nr:hypothetical protein [Blastopirellula sp.]HAY81880.1 hypothetical protein [Planctomycetaceae bacterium]